MAVLMAAMAMSVLTSQLTALSGAAAAAAELFRIMDNPSELDPLDPSGEQPSTCVGNITINNVNFAYPSRPSAPVLQDFSISIPAGKTTALVGPSGSGKSTLVGLLERWYKPANGSLILDDVEISKYNVKWLRSNIRLVQQVGPDLKIQKLTISNTAGRNQYFLKARFLTTLPKALSTLNDR